MERPLKQRLIGATILVVIAVVVLPGLLSGRRDTVTLEPTRDDTGVPLRAHEFSLGDTPTAEEQAVAADKLQPDPVPGEVAAAPEPLPMTPPSGVPAAATASASAPAPANVPAAAPAATMPAPAAQINRPLSPPMAAPVAVTPPASKPAPVPAGATKPAAKPAPTPVAPAVSLSGWVVQIGSFGTRQKADELVAKLQGKGFRAFTLPYTAAGRTLHRVRVGPEQNRQKADQIAKRLEADGYQPHVAPQE